MYSPSPLTQVPKFYDSKNNGDIATGFLALPQLGCYEDENAQESVWTFSVLFLSENYEEILPTLAWVKSLATFMEPGEKGFALIYDYFWGDKTVMAHVVLENQQAFLKHTSRTTQLEPEVLETANAALSKAYDKFSELYKDE
ncbi:hypothetical protein FLA_4004 [Filimonas lacunae]|nr:hypothetical protein FLA_4004 [Filimonas lacunae]